MTMDDLVRQVKASEQAIGRVFASEKINYRLHSRLMKQNRLLWQTAQSRGFMFYVEFKARLEESA